MVIPDGQRGYIYILPIKIFISLLVAGIQEHLYATSRSYYQFRRLDPGKDQFYPVLAALQATSITDLHP